jgi:hypothetical protein
MKSPALFATALVVGCVAGQLGAIAQTADTDEVVAVYSSVNPAYQRARLPDGSLQPQSYTFGEGGNLAGRVKDDSIDPLRFAEIARAIAPALSSMGFEPSIPPDSTSTNLLIMVYWGATGAVGTATSPEYQIAQSLVPPPRAKLSPPPTGLGGTAMASDPRNSGRASEGQMLAAAQAADDSAMEQSMVMSNMANTQRDRQDLRNAALLGYLVELKRTESYAHTQLATRRQDIIDEIEEGRYFVILMAYDLSELVKHKQRRLLWETRFSVPSRHVDFAKELAAMARSAANYFGENSPGLTRTSLREGHIKLGELQILGTEPEKK